MFELVSFMAVYRMCVITNQRLSVGAVVRCLQCIALTHAQHISTARLRLGLFCDHLLLVLISLVVTDWRNDLLCVTVCGLH